MAFEEGIYQTSYQISFDMKSFYARGKGGGIMYKFHKNAWFNIPLLKQPSNKLSPAKQILPKGEVPQN